MIKEKNAQLDVASIVDLVFNRLIFFALSLNFNASSLLYLALLKTSLPERVPLQATDIQINKGLEIFVYSRAVTLAVLPDALAALFQQSG
jgi:biopolymer transport protein ExbD